VFFYIGKEGGKMKNLKNFKIIFLSSVLCLLSSVFCPLSYAGPAVSVAGGDWAVGTTGMGMTSTTVAAKWTITGGSIVETVYIKADGTNWHPGSAAGDKTFVLKHNASGSWSGAITNSGDGIKLKALGVSGTATFGLQFTQPTASTDVTGEQTLTVTLTAKAYVAPLENIWEIIDANLVCVGTATGYLMWPRLKTCAATNNYVGKQYKTTSSSGMPTWSDTTKSYTYPSGETSLNYPAFAWAEALEYAGYTDWRMPTWNEISAQMGLRNVYPTYVDIGYPWMYWSSTEVNTTNAYCGFDGNGYTQNYGKISSMYVRAVRSGP
jgi:hypothetical protein